MGAAHGAAEGGRAEGEDPAVASDEGVPTPAGGRDGSEDRPVQLRGRHVAEEGSVAVAEDATLVGENPVALAARSARQAGDPLGRPELPGGYAAEVTGVAEGADVAGGVDDPVAVAGRGRLQLG